MSSPEATRPDEPVSRGAPPRRMNTTGTLCTAADLIAALTQDDHLRPPGTVVVSAGHVTIMPESTSSTPVTSLLAWADHMDTDPVFEAAAITGMPFRSLHITATGEIDGMTVAISASTVRVSDEIARKIEPNSINRLSKLDVIELACGEDVLGV